MAAATRLGPKTSLLVHLLMLSWYVFTIWSNCTLQISDRHPGVRSYGGRWKYLTFINLVSQALLFGLCVLADAVHGAVSVTRARDFHFTVLAFPVGTFVFISFWTLYTYDRELVYPKLLDEIIPIWLNHAMHTVIMPLLLLQMFLQNHRYPSRTKGIFSLALFAALYLSWVLWVHHASGIWVYPIMAHLSPVGLCVFLGGASLFMAPLYLLGEKLSLMMWSSTGNQKKKKK
ncbi:androgen dependent TFPI regulating protein 1 isoform X1 [Sinocyclocheilus grahami]|uniref:Androgen-dependent TFPI-regulating protein-like n=1 Tax=Sinocyclocheilus grahami TaxID=75366 RepID=A0A672RXB2_SINGR|nr:PREDICTED: androgen-dependent TFPI-regulating protein-like isoform X1 [Sinocyclocheilus grahami]